MFTVVDKPFSVWIMEEMDNRGISQAELARRAKMSKGAVNHVVNGTRSAGAEMCLAIAGAFNMPPEAVFRKAGLLPPATEEDQQLKELAYLATQLPDGELEDLIAYARHRLQLSEKRGHYATKKTDK